MIYCPAEIKEIKEISAISAISAGHKNCKLVCCPAEIKEIKEISAISAISAGLKTIYNSIDTVLQDIAGVEINQDSDLQT